MKRSLLFAILFTTVCNSHLICQEEISLQLERMYKRLVFSQEDSVRIRINDSITFMVDQYVRSDSIFENNLGRTRFLGQILSPDSLVKIINWNLLLTEVPGLSGCQYRRCEKSFRRSPGRSELSGYGACSRSHSAGARNAISSPG